MIRSDEVICPTCKGNVSMRISRDGFLQRHVLGHFGLYPWKCGACGTSFLYRSRGHRAAGSSDHAHRSGGPMRKQRRA